MEFDIEKEIREGLEALDALKDNADRQRLLRRVLIKAERIALLSDRKMMAYPDDNIPYSGYDSIVKLRKQDTWNQYEEQGAIMLCEDLLKEVLVKSRFAFIEDGDLMDGEAFFEELESGKYD